MVFAAYAQGDPLVFFLKFGSFGTLDGQFSNPTGIAVNSTHILVTELGNNRVQIFDLSGNFEDTFGSFGAGNGQFSNPTGIAVNSTHILVTELNNDRVQIFDLSGNFEDTFGSNGAGNGQFNAPEDIAVNSTHILVADTVNDRVQIFDLSGNFEDTFGSFGAGNGQFVTPRGIAVNSTHILVADGGNERVQIFDQSGNFVHKFGSPGAGNGQFDTPVGIAVNSGTIFVADSNNDRVQLFIPSLEDGSSVEMGVNDGGTANVALPSGNKLAFTYPAGKDGTFTVIDSDEGDSAAGLVFLGDIVDLTAPANTCNAGCTIKFTFTDSDLSAGGFTSPTQITIFHDDNDDGNFALDEELATTVSPTSAPGPYTATATTTSTSKFGIGGTPPPADEGGSSGGGCKGDCTPPSFSSSFTEGEHPLAIGGVTYPTLGFYNEKTETAILKTHTKIPVKLLVFENGGPDNISHISIYMNLRGLEREIHNSDTYIRYYSGQDLVVSDPNGFFSGVGFSASQKGDKLEAVFEITFAKPMETSDLILYVWDARANAVQVKVLDALEVVQSENIKDTNTQDDAIASQTIQDQTEETASLVTEDHQIEVIKMWAGYSQESAADSELLDVLGFDGAYIPHWVKRFFGDGIYNDQLEIEDFMAALEYLISVDVVK